jgi:hypothetical protein
MKARIAALTSLVLGASCTGAVERSDSADAPTGPSLPSVSVEVDQEPSGPLIPPPEAGPLPPRSRRRMDLDQLDAAIRVATGGLAWEERGRNQLEELAPTLGKPDYIQVIDEDLSPSAMFQKFLNDAARAVCDRLMVEDPMRPASERTFFVEAEQEQGVARKPQAVRNNLTQLLLRFHGRPVQANGPELQPWVELMKAVEAGGGDAGDAWTAVCVGLIIHPNFYTY